MVDIPVQLPTLEESVSPSRGVPVTAGATVLTGGWAGVTSVEAAESRVAVPPGLPAVTRTATLRSRSASASR